LAALAHDVCVTVRRRAEHRMGGRGRGHPRRARLCRHGAWPLALQLHRWDLEAQSRALLSGDQQPGIFAVGDVRHGSIKRCVSASERALWRSPSCIATSPWD